MNKRELSHALASNKRVYGTCVTSPNPNWIPRIQRTGIDFVFMAWDSGDEKHLYGINTTILPIVDEPLSTDIWRRMLE